jgi:hypothetical protein
MKLISVLATRTCGAVIGIGLIQIIFSAGATGVD